MHAEEKIFAAFYTAKKDRLYFNELKLLTRLSNSSLQNALARLLKEKILIKEETKGNVFYLLFDKKSSALAFAKIDLAKFEGLHRNVRIPLNDFIRIIPKSVVTILLFGSSARKEEKKESDIDLLCIMHSYNDPSLQKIYEKEIITEMEAAKKEIQTRSAHAINMAFATIEDVKEGRDHLIKQAKETGFPLCNQQLYYEALYETR
jgi:predicted nucleotidyltransferase